MVFLKWGSPKSIQIHPDIGSFQLATAVARLGFGHQNGGSNFPKVGPLGSSTRCKLDPHPNKSETFGHWFDSLFPHFLGHTFSIPKLFKMKMSGDFKVSREGRDCRMPHASCRNPSSECNDNGQKKASSNLDLSCAPQLVRCSSRYGFWVPGRFLARLLCGLLLGARARSGVVPGVDGSRGSGMG